MLNGDISQEDPYSEVVMCRLSRQKGQTSLVLKNFLLINPLILYLGNVLIVLTLTRLRIYYMQKITYDA